MHVSKKKGSFSAILVSKSLFHLLVLVRRWIFELSEPLSLHMVGQQDYSSPKLKSCPSPLAKAIGMRSPPTHARPMYIFPARESSMRSRGAKKIERKKRPKTKNYPIPERKTTNTTQNTLLGFIKPPFCLSPVPKIMTVEPSNLMARYPSPRLPSLPATTSHSHPIHPAPHASGMISHSHPPDSPHNCT